ncbi:MAG: PGF-CTERM-anchored ABC transporter substrate-binding protein [Halolamina sp.]
MRTNALLSTVLVAFLVLAPATAAGAGVSAPVAGSDAGVQAQSQSVPECEFPVTLTDASGTEVTVEEQPDRVTTLAPSAAQTMWEIGGKEQVVGVTQYASYLDGADARANVSAAGFGVSTEKIIGTDPDLVLAPNVTSQETVQQLRDAGLTVFLFETATSIEDIADKTRTVGQLTGNCAGAAEANEWMRQNVAEARTVTEGETPVQTMYPVGGGYVAGDETFIHAMITASGGQNLAADEITGYQQLSAEVVVERDPIFLVVTAQSDDLLSQSPWNQTTAGEQGNTVTVETQYINQPAPRSVVYGVRNLTEGFHPDAGAQAEWTSRSEVSVATETETETATATDSATAETTESAGPGFGAVAAVVGVLAASLLAFRER